MGGRGASSGLSDKGKKYGHKHAELEPHVHHGYFHNERDGNKGATQLSTEEKKMVERVKKVWYDYLGRR